ncbi:MAG TPA: aldo/keto reductase [Abditibacteriaceae bacterium]
MKTLSSFPVGLGCMSLTGTWNPADMNAERETRAIQAFEAALESGIDFYDHADIYGGGSCEEVFSKCLAAFPDAREKIYIATKGGICSGFYNLSQSYLRECIDRSLRRMNIDYIDLYQLHRPDPLTHPAETAAALSEALESGKIRAVGVSNYYPEQVRALQKHLDAPIVSNQISISLNRLDPIYEGLKTAGETFGDGTLDQCIALDMVPLAYSPLRNLPLRDGDESEESELRTMLREMANKYSATPAQIAVAWLLAHPAKIVPLVGTANPDHIRDGAGAAKIKLEREDWYGLWTAAWGRRVP